MTGTRRHGGDPIEDLLRDLTPRVLGTLLRWSGDFTAAEDALQEAMLAAVHSWRADGLPDNPGAWLLTVARRRATDAVRADIARREREWLVTAQSRSAGPATPADPPIPDSPGADREHDDTLTLFFSCCHPVLTPAHAVALTLRTVGGLTTAEIARAFLIPEATMTQRLTRARRRLAALDRPFAPPAAGQWEQRLAAVLHVLYLIFTEGHTSTSGPRLARADLSMEAIRLTRQLRRQLPDDPEVGGLLALMLLTDARCDARTGPHGELVPLAEQDRHRWNRAAITEGLRLASAAAARGLTGAYRIQAAIAGVHAQAVRYTDTDWDSVRRLYLLLGRVAPGPLVTLNLAVATAMVDGPHAGLALVADLDTALRSTHRLAAVRAHLYEMSGDTAGAIAHYTDAAGRTGSRAEYNYLTLRAARLRHPPHDSGEPQLRPVISS
ncbi:RNA polymerase sigma factor [Nocardia grenadensis]|uniref:RNA polymerase sigma factor n=1 Tax=Nocardia grenadensis TaxID=931537 RepID=UPI000AFD93BD|nr:sigma-70 family RNA polymerase sigma factor [Nocardia grenadensis]